jgi:hypothetical protein
MILFLAADAQKESAASWLKQLVLDFGLGFHLDTRPEDYISTDGTKCFDSDECAVLTQSLINLFAILGDEMPYDICADQASAMFAESLGMKPPLEYHDPDFQNQLLRYGTREELIAWLCWNDPNGIYSDDDSIAEERLPLELDQAREIIRKQITRDSRSGSES